MTTITAKRTETSTWPLFAALGVGVSVILCALGTFQDLTNNESGEPDGLVQFLPVVGIILVAAAIVFPLVVRTATPESSGRRALILGVLSVLSLAVFYTGLPAVLAAGAIACASMRRSTTGMVAVGLSVVTLGLALWAAIAG